MAGSPDTVYLMSEAWPPDAAAALEAAADIHQADLRRRGSGEARASLPMPAGELFASIILPRMVGRHESIQTTFAVGDCEPAVHTLASLHSSHHQMRELAREAAREGTTWVPAHVRREANSDADRLSHPHLLTEVRDELRASDFTTVVLRPSPEDWGLLTRVIETSLTMPRLRKKRRRAR